MGLEKSLHTETDKAYAELHRAIVRGELLPNQRLKELPLAEHLGVGRAAIRTALDRLTHDGLVEHEPNRGAHVRHISLEEALEMLEVRGVLEGLALRYAARNATEQEVDGLRAMVERMERCLAAGDLLTISEANAQLHAALLRTANHQAVTRLLERLQAHHVHFQYRTILVAGRAENSVREHRTIVNAVANHDADAAEAAMRQHLHNAATALRQCNELGTHWQTAT